MGLVMTKNEIIEKLKEISDSSIDDIFIVKEKLIVVSKDTKECVLNEINRTYDFLKSTESKPEE